MATFSCINCRILFVSPEEQRDHYHGEFHKFNLMRKVAGLPPATAQQYEEKIRLEKKQEELNNSQSADTKKYCSECGKSFNSADTYNQHSKSKKHIQQAQKNKTKEKPLKPKEQITEDVVISDMDEEGLTEEEAIEKRLEQQPRLPLTECLFCRHQSDELELNVVHMSKEHGMFIPDFEFLNDLAGLIQFLGEKVGVAWSCLYCSRPFRSLEAVRAHMQSLNHCKIPYSESMDEYLDFYDFNIALEDESDEEKQVMEEEQISTDEEGVDEHIIVQDQLEHKIPGEIADDGFSLVLKGGKLAPHRALALYHKQKYRRPDTRDSVTLSKIMSQYNQLGWYDKEERKIRRKELKTMGLRDRRKQYHSMKVGIKSNKTTQHHYREQVVF